jgi:protein-S-isoprenylcysteine O-methyltransferase Ste14
MTAPQEPTAVPSAATRRTAWLMVLAQFVLLGLIVGLPDRHDWVLPVAVTRACIVAAVIGVVPMVIAALALGRGLTAAPLPNEHTQLRTTGLYRHVRHPIYTGLLLFAIACSVRSSSTRVAATCMLLIVLINVKARWEERRLTQRFADYAAYAAHTPRFIPSRMFRR